MVAVHERADAVLAHRHHEEVRPRPREHDPIDRVAAGLAGADGEDDHGVRRLARRLRRRCRAGSRWRRGCGRVAPERRSDNRRASAARRRRARTAATRAAPGSGRPRRTQAPVQQHAADEETGDRGGEVLERVTADQVPEVEQGAVEQLEHLGDHVAGEDPVDVAAVRVARRVRERDQQQDADGVGLQDRVRERRCRRRRARSRASRGPRRRRPAAAATAAPGRRGRRSDPPPGPRAAT